MGRRTLTAFLDALSIPTPGCHEGSLNFAAATLRSLLAATAFFLPNPAQALVDVPWLEWDAPSECPSEEQIEARALAWYGSSPLPAALRVRAQLTWLDHHWHVTVQVDVEGQKGHRELDFASCSDASDFVALTAVLALRPDFTDGGQGEPIVPPEAPAKPTSASTKINPAPPRAATVPQRELPPLRRALPPKEAKVLAWLSLGASGQWGALPYFGGGIGADAGGFYQGWRGSVGALGFPGVSSWPEPSAAPIHFARVAGRLRLCRVLSNARLQIAPCVGIEIGAYTADQASTENGDRQEVVDVWLAGDLGLEASYAIVPKFRFFGEVGLTVPFLAPTILLDDGTMAFQPTWAPSLTTGIRVILGRSR